MASRSSGPDFRPDGSTRPGDPLAAPFAGVDEQFGYRMPYGQQGLQLRELIDVLLRGKWIILAAVLAVAVPVALYTLAQPDVYSAYSLLLVEPDDGDLAGVLPTAGAPLLQKRNLGNELLVLRQSLPLARRAAEQLMTYRAVPETGEPLSILAVEEGQALTADLVAARLQGQYVQVAPEGRDLDAIRVSAVSTVPGEAALIANVMAEAYLSRTQESSRASVSASRTFLEEQVDAQSDSLRRIEAAVRAFMTREQAVALDEESSYLVSQLSALEAARDEATVEMQMAAATAGALRDELGALEPRLAARVASDVDRELAQTQQRLAAVEARLEEVYARTPALRTAPDAPPEIARLREQEAELSARLRTLRQRFLDESLAAGGPNLEGAGLERVAELRRQIVDQQIAASGLRARRDVLQQRIASGEASLSAIPRQAIELAQLQRERQSTERLYLALEEKLQEARVAEQSELGYAEQIRPAQVPAFPFSPNRPRTVVLGLLLGLGLGVALAFVRVRMDHRLHRPDDLRDRGLPLLGVVPDVTPLVKQEFDGAETVEVAGRRFDTRLVSLLSPMAAASEAYRALRTSLQFSRPDTVVQTVLVTSANPGEGKSTTATNLAVVLAQAGRRVLIVDADLRKPTLHTKLGLNRSPGLVELLFSTDRLPLERLATGVDDLYALPAGASAPNPSELLGSRAMRDLIGSLRDAFDVVIFDAPPVLAATDAVLLSTQCDAAIVVARSGMTRDFELEQALADLRAVGAPVIGTVLNGFDSRQAYGYRYRYAYRYEQLYSYGAEEALRGHGQRGARPA